MRVSRSDSWGTSTLRGAKWGKETQRKSPRRCGRIKSVYHLQCPETARGRKSKAQRAIRE